MTTWRGIDLDRDITSLLEGRFAAVAVNILCRHNIRVVNIGAGRAWINRRAIITPHPRTERTFAEFAHEVGHILNGNVRPRWRSEWLAWRTAFRIMRERDIRITPGTVTKVQRMLGSYVARYEQMPRARRDFSPELIGFLNGVTAP